MYQPETQETTTGAPQDCPLTGLFSLLSGPWTCLILWHLAQQPSLRFLELKRRIPGISAKILTERLRMLADATMIERKVVGSGGPQQVHYRLSGRGQQLYEAFGGLHALALEWGPLTVRKRRARAPQHAKGHQDSASSEAAE